MRVNPNTSQGAVFDLDYIRWSSQAVPHGTPLESASSAPMMVSINPSSGAEAGGKKVIIKGSNFDAKTVVTFNGVSAGKVKLVSAYRLTCVAPPHTDKGWVDVTVRNAGGSATLSKGFFYGVLPKAQRLQPDKGTNLGGQTVTITGNGFQTGARVTFGQQEAGEVA